MTELAIPLHRSVEPSSETYRGQAVARLAEWAESARAAHEIAQSLCRTSFVPEAFRDKPEETTAAILAGAEVGLTPMAAIRSFDIIQGVAAPRALTLRAIVQSMGHQILVDESTATRCIVRARRRDTTEWQKVSWTMDRAMQLGLPQRTTKSGRPNQWKTQPQAMLVARATAEAARLVAADAILGIGYAAEEISDGETVASATEPASGSKGRRMSLPKPAPVEPEPEPAETPKEANPPADSPPAKPPTGGITTAQRSKMLALFNGLDIKDRADRLRLSAAIVGREVDSANKLNQQEASVLIDTLEHAQRAEDPRQYLEELAAAVAVQETLDAEIVEE